MKPVSPSNSNHQSPAGVVCSRPWAQVVVRGESQAETHSLSPPSSASAMENTHSGSSPKAAPPSHCGSSPKAAKPLVPPAPDNNHAADGGSDSNCNNVGGLPKKSAWKKPKGVVDVNPLEGVSWPALSEAARASPKLAAESSSRTVSNGSASTSEGPMNSHSNQKQAFTTTNRTTAGTGGRYRNSKRNGNGGSSNSGSSSGVSVQGGFKLPNHPSPPLPARLPLSHFGRIPPHPLNGFHPMIQGYHPLQRQYNPVGGFIPQPSMMNGHLPPFQRGNYERGDTAFQHSFGRGDYVDDSRFEPRGLVSFPPPPTQFLPLQPMRSYDSVYTTRMPMEPSNSVLYTTQPQPAFMHPAETIRGSLIHQIEYYFSDDNLVKDRHLKNQMDDQGWVPVSVIASFRLVKKLTNDIQFIKDSLMNSTTVEVQGDMLRRKDAWMKWVASSSRVSPDSDSSSQIGSSSANLTTSLHNITFEEKASNSNPQEEDYSRGHSS